MAATESTLRRARLHGFDAWTNEQGIAVLEHMLISGAAGDACLVKHPDLPAAVQTGAAFPTQVAAISEEPIEDQVQQVVAELVEGPVTLDSDLNESGLDSLAAAELSMRLSRAVGMKLPATLLSDAPTLRELQRYVHKEKAMQHEQAEQAQGVSHVKRSILVIGAGVGGITFAHQLVSAGEHVIVMEKSDVAGGCWSLGNESSQLQIDSPSYMLDYDRPEPWPTTYPSKQQVIHQVKSAAQALPDLRLNHAVQQIQTKQPGAVLQF